MSHPTTNKFESWPLSAVLRPSLQYWLCRLYVRRDPNTWNFYARLRGPCVLVLQTYGFGNIGQPSSAHSSHPFASRASYGERPSSIAAWILRQRSQFGLTVISLVRSRSGCSPVFFACSCIKVPCGWIASHIEARRRALTRAARPERQGGASHGCGRISSRRPPVERAGRRWRR
jgi:hypothetical protein